MKACKNATVGASEPHVFRLVGGDYVIVDYESKFLRTNFYKYLGYVTRLGRKYDDGDGNGINLRIIVIYTCDVDSAPTTLDIGAVRITVEQGFLSHIDGPGELKKYQAKIAVGGSFTDEELMKFIVLPLTVKGNEKKIQMIDEVIEAGKKLKMIDESAGSFVLSGMCVAAVNFMTKEQSEKIVEVIRMTRVGQMVVNQVEHEERERVARRMIDAGESIDKIVNYSHLSEVEVNVLMNAEQTQNSGTLSPA